MTAYEARKQVQKALGVDPDGMFGPRTISAYVKLKEAQGDSEWPPAASVAAPVVPAASPGVEFDERTERHLATLNAKSQPLFREFMRKLIPYMAAKGVVAKIISGTRTFAEQDALYAQGRTKPGKIVTKAKAGQSNHNFGCACDIALFLNGDYLEDSPLYLEAGPIGESCGLQWGGRWRSIKDFPHYEATQFKQAAK